MNWLIFGIGAIGAYVGGSLALAEQTGRRSNRVVFVDRPAVAAEIRRTGIHLNIAGRNQVLHAPQVADSLEEALLSGPFDVAVFALKSYDTLNALEGMLPHLSQLPPFLCLQNGVDNEPTLQSLLGEGRVIAGTVTSAIGKAGPGQVALERKRGMGVAAGHALSLPIVQSLTEAGLNARLYPNAADMKWSKLLTNLLANASSAILDLTPAEIFSHPRLFRMEIAALREALQVMKAQGIHIVDLPGTPVRALALATRLPAWLSRPLLQRAVGGGRGGKMPSFYLDLHSGSGKSEVGYLNGAVARHGERLGIPTPVNKLLTEVLLSLTRGETDPAEFARQPEKLLSRLYQASRS